MSVEDKSQIETPEEIAGEKAHLSEIKEEDIRTSVISEYGFDADKDKERIDKLVAKEMGYKKTISTAIGQKVKYRTKVTELAAKPPKSDDQGQDVNKIIDERLEKERLDDMPYSDDLKATIKKVAAINGVSVKIAKNDPYVATLIEKWQKDADAKDAALGRKNHNGKGGANSSDDLTPPDFDLNTPEGRKDYDKWKSDKIAGGA